MVAVLRHTLTFNDLDGARGDDLAGNDLNDEELAVEVLDGELTAGKSGQQVDLDGSMQIVALANKFLVGLLVNDKHDITRNDIGALVTLTSKSNLLLVDHTLVNVDLEDLALLQGLLAVTGLASVLGVNNVTLTVTVVTNGLVSLDHGAHLSRHESHTLTLTGSTGLDSALLAALTVTLGTQHCSCQGQLGNFTLVQVSEGGLESVHDIAGALGARGLAAAKHAAHTAHAAHASKEVRKDVIGVAAHAASAAGQALGTILVVNLTLLAVGEDLVGARDLLELFSGLRVVLVLIGVVFQSVDSVCLFDFSISSVGLDAFEQLAKEEVIEGKSTYPEYRIKQSL